MEAHSCPSCHFGQAERRSSQTLTRVWKQAVGKLARLQPGMALPAPLLEGKTPSPPHPRLSHPAQNPGMLRQRCPGFVLPRLPPGANSSIQALPGISGNSPAGSFCHHCASGSAAPPRAPSRTNHSCGPGREFLAQLRAPGRENLLQPAEPPGPEPGPGHTNPAPPELLGSSSTFPGT